MVKLWYLSLFVYAFMIGAILMRILGWRWDLERYPHTDEGVSITLFVWARRFGLVLRTRRTYNRIGLSRG